MQIGYVRVYFAYDVWQLVQRCEVDFIELYVDRVNSDAPLQNRVLCRMHACWPMDSNRAAEMISCRFRHACRLGAIHSFVGG